MLNAGAFTRDFATVGTEGKLKTLVLNLFYNIKGGEIMAQVKCGRTKCLYHGTEMCTADRITITGDGCITFDNRIGPADLKAPFNPHCERKNGKYISVNPHVVK